MLKSKDIFKGEEGQSELKAGVNITDILTNWL